MDYGQDSVDQSRHHTSAATQTANWRQPYNQHYHGVAGQVSVLPATQTTVVTTTTTTTMTLPPFVCKAPKRLRMRDPATYPLAAAPTPPSLKRIRLDVGEHTTYLEELEDTQDHTGDYTKQQEQIDRAGGFIRSSSTSFSAPDARPGPRPSVRSASRRSTKASPNRSHSARSISALDAEELHSFHRRNKPLRVTAHPLRQHLSSQESDQESEESEADDEASVRTPIDHAARKQSQTRRSESVGGLQSPAEISEEQEFGPQSSTSSLAESDVNPFASSIRQSENLRRPRVPPTIDTASANDVSLPSPSLSPITASRARGFPQTGVDSHDSDSSFTNGTQGNTFESAAEENDGGTANMNRGGVDHNPTTISDIFSIIEKFDDLPENVKNYCLHGILKRCTKSNLHFVSQTIDPALRCDFLTRLPAELGLQVLDHLDAKSLCAAAQVSRKWRTLVDTNEKVWSKLFEEDGFRLPEGEVEKAIRGGWGWYADGRCDNTDQPLRKSTRTPKLRVRLNLNNSTDTSEACSRKRSAPAVPTSLSKRRMIKHEQESQDEVDDDLDAREAPIMTELAQAQRRARSTPSTMTRQSTRRSQGARSESWASELPYAHGPNAIAKLAQAAVPKPRRSLGGLPTLRNLHLYKSLYQRHHMIRQSWMDPNAKPQHLAFRAHQRHVVTCLQFDSDVILTGSDDSNIDIYNTKTGASVARLQGHEGGVWALEYQDDLLVSGSTDRSVRVWDMKRGRGLHVFQGHTSTVRCLQILKPTEVGQKADGTPIMMPKEPLIITGSRDATCRIWKLPKIDDEPIQQESGVINDNENPYFVRVLSGHTNSVRAIAAHGDTLVSGSYDSTVRVWTVSTGELVHRLQGHTTKVYSVVLDQKRNRCISGSMDNNVRIWSLETGASLYSLEGHTSLVGLLDLRDDVLVSAAADATLRIWDPANGACRHTLAQHTGAITCFAHDGQKIISGSDRTLKMWNTSTGECVRDLLTDLNGVWQIKFDQRRCVAAVQRNNWTYIEVMDFGAARDGVPESERGRRIVVNNNGLPVQDQTEVDFIALQAAA